MKVVKNCVICLFVSCLTVKGYTQITDLNKKVYNADSLASGNYKDVLASFFQLAIKNLSGKDKSLVFNSNVFALMLKANPTLAVDTTYLKNRFFRNLNVSFDLRLDSSYQTNGFASGIKYAIVNKRDKTVSDEFNQLVLLKNNEFHQLNQGIVAARQGLADTSLQRRCKEQASRLLTDIAFRFDSLDSDVRKVVMKVIEDSNLVVIKKLIKADPKSILRSVINEGYNYYHNAYQNKVLWTIGISDTSYSDGRLFKTVEISSQFLKGIIHPSNAANLELDLKATLNYGDDSIRTGKKLDRQIFSFEPGVNLVLKGRNKQSYLEFKLSGSYNNIWKGLYAKEAQIINTINGTLRLRIFDELWLPLRITYDPKRGNIFGFLNVVTNFTGLGKFLNPKKSAS